MGKDEAENVGKMQIVKCPVYYTKAFRFCPIRHLYKPRGIRIRSLEVMRFL